MVGDHGVFGQRRDVEPAVCYVGEAVPGAATVHESVDV